MSQRVLATIGCPGSGKSTLAGSFDPKEWVTITLDDFRQALWPPNRSVYWQELRQSERASAARAVLHASIETALDVALQQGFNVILPDTHIRLPAFQRELDIVAAHDITIEWTLFDVQWSVLVERNQSRPVDHRVSPGVLERAYADLWAHDAWWRSLPVDQIKIVKVRESWAA